MVPPGCANRIDGVVTAKGGMRCAFPPYRASAYLPRTNRNTSR